MALVKCKECGEQVSTEATTCPKCGAKAPKKKSLLTWIILIFIVLVVYNYFPSSDRAASSTAGTKYIHSSVGGLTISKAQFGDKWPLTINKGVVKCTKNNAVVFEAEGKTYAVNGAAQGLAYEMGYHSLSAIRIPDLAIGGKAKKSISPVLDSGVKLCN
jgi:hypothetical protein